MKKTASVFLSSTRDDLEEERNLVLEGIRLLHLNHNSMEYFGARDNPPIETCLNEVRKSDIMVVVVGHKYGSLVPELNISYTESEYNEGYKLGKPCLVYFRSDEVEILPKFIEQEPDKIAQLQRWKKTLRERHTIKFFKKPTNLALQVMADLSRQVNQENIPRHIWFFDSDPANTFFSRYINKANSQSGNIGLFFYDLDIVNVSDKSYTIKDVILKYDLEGKTYSTISTVLQTGLVLSKNRKENAIRVRKVIQDRVDTIFLIGWNNIRTIIGKRKVLVPGSTLRGSAMFVLETDKVEKIKYIENMEIIMTDFSRNTTNQPIEIQESWIHIVRDTFVKSETFRHKSE